MLARQLLLALPGLLGSQSPATPGAPEASTPPTVVATRRRAPLRIDGRLDEPDWQRAAPATGFRQQDPSDGEPATQRTEVRFLYDADALYVGARMYDAAGANGVRGRLARRDEQPNTDYIMLVFDTFHDHTGRTVLRVNPAGVKYDALSTSRANPDAGWNAVWEVATRVDSLGWTAEFRIPFSELRLATSGEQTWGLQIWRYVQRLNETSMWSYWTRREPGGPSRFGELTGLAPSLGAVALEAVPYVATGTAPRTPVDYAHADGGTRPTLNVGMDLRLRRAGVAATLTVDPDFGQVEVDPSVLNLTASETFFPEKRPFFVQDAGVLAFGGMDCFVCGYSTPLALYYSRRIGRPPSLHPAGAVMDMASATRILGAARVTAQSRNGWTLGVLGARTDREMATVLDSLHHSTNVAVEPATDYLVARAEKRSAAGEATVGAMVTAVDRSVSDRRDPLADLLARHAMSGGVDTDVWWARHTYHLSASAALSAITGDSVALARIAASNVHDLLRPGRRHGADHGIFGSSYDPSSRTLDGYAGTLRIAREAGRWLWEGAGEVLSPGFEANNLGFAPVADRLWLLANVQRHLAVPHAWYQEAWLTVGMEALRNFDGEIIGREDHVSLAVTLPAAWTSLITFRHLPRHLDDRLLRGGPTVAIGAGDALRAQIGTDPRRAFSVQDTTWWSTREDGSRSIGVNPIITARPLDALTLTLGLRLEHNDVAAQFVGAPVVYGSSSTASSGNTAQPHWVTARLRERTAAVEARIAAALTPTLSLDAYVQPFMTASAYDGFGEFPHADALHPRVYGRDQGTITRMTGTDASLLQIDPDGASGPLQPFTLRDPSGTTMTLRGTAVLRWEYRPGSTLFVAWTQTRAGTAPWDALRFERDGSALLGTTPHDALLLKVTYRLAR